MYGLKDLKPEILVTKREVPCPVQGCQHTVVRQTRKDLITEPRFHCQDHPIFISPSTWEYDDPAANILWNFDDLKKLFKVKRETKRIGRDNSEDAVTWNVFQYLINSGNLTDLLKEMCGRPVLSPVPYFWSGDSNGQPWGMLNTARDTFGETRRRGSEPDLAIQTDKVLFFIEAKLGAGNKTKPSTPGNPKKYTTGGDGWFTKVFSPGATYEHVAEIHKRYELLRFWLLGSWMAAKASLDFVLVNLVRDAEKEDIEAEFGKHIVQNEDRRFVKWTWERIYSFIEQTDQDTHSKRTILEYFQQKTMGYVPKGKDRRLIVRAFAV